MKQNIADNHSKLKIIIYYLALLIFFFINNLLTVTYNIYLTYTTLHYTIKQNTTYLIQYSTYTIGNTLYLALLIPWSVAAFPRVWSACKLWETHMLHKKTWDGVIEEADYSQFLVLLNFPLFFITRICLYFFARMRYKLIGKALLKKRKSSRVLSKKDHHVNYQQHRSDYGHVLGNDL